MTSKTNSECKVCLGTGYVPTGQWHITVSNPGHWVPDGKTKECPGCDGTGITLSARKKEK